MSARRLLVAALLAVLGLPSARPVLADERAALEETTAGDRALASGDLEAAERSYRAALDALPEYLPARRGLGEAALGRGRKGEALAAFRRTVREAAALPKVPAEWRDAVQASRRRLDELDVHGKELDGILRAHAAALAALAERQADRDPDLAERALGTALALVPDHEGALSLRERLASKGLLREAVFDGRQIEDWDGGRSEWWKVVDGAIVAEAKDVATFVRTEKRIEGDFDLILEARMTEAYGDNPFFALLGAWNAEYDHSRYGVLAGTLQWLEVHAQDQKDRLFRAEVSDLPKPLDPKAWNTYEIRYRGKRMEIALNGRSLAGADRPPERAGGHVGLLAQDCRVEFRRVEVLRR